MYYPLKLQKQEWQVFCLHYRDLRPRDGSQNAFAPCSQTGGSVRPSCINSAFFKEISMKRIFLIATAALSLSMAAPRGHRYHHIPNIFELMFESPEQAGFFMPEPTHFFRSPLGYSGGITQPTLTLDGIIEDTKENRYSIRILCDGFDPSEVSLETLDKKGVKSITIKAAHSSHQETPASKEQTGDENQEDSPIIVHAERQFASAQAQISFRIPDYCILPSATARFEGRDLIIDIETIKQQERADNEAKPRAITIKKNAHVSQVK